MGVDNFFSIELEKWIDITQGIDHLILYIRNEFTIENCERIKT